MTGWSNAPQCGSRNLEKQHTRFGRRMKMSAIKKKSETCEEQLRRMCKNIAQDITDGKRDSYEWLKDVYDIEWITYNDKSYKAARLMVAGGGPNIWVNLQDMTVDGYWASDKCSWGFVDNIGLDDYCEEMYASS
tara:strand:- start:40 stop:441 length:402 start_codon:yes stop_codon:yes gene_type:complete